MEATIYVPIALMLIFLFLGVPVGVTLGICGILGLYMLKGSAAFIMAPQMLFASVNNFLLVAVPLFITMGVILGHGGKAGIGGRLYKFFDAMLRHIPGGLGIATVLTCSVLAAMIGTSVAVAVMVGAFAVKNMTDYGYPITMSTGAVVGGGALGMLIPPSLPMIFYGSMTMESIGDLFMAGMIPGLIVSFLFCAYIFVKCSMKKSVVKVAKAASWKDRWDALTQSYWGLVIPSFIIIALYTGLATPTELAALGCFLSLFGCLFVHKTIKFGDILGVLRHGVRSSAMILIIIAGAVLFGSYVVQAGISEAMVRFFKDNDISLAGFLIISMLIILVMGMFLEGAAIMLISIPVLHPVCVAYGFPVIAYAVMLVINIECAMITPPVGLNLFAISGICKTEGIPATMSTLISGSWPYLVMYLSVMALVAVFPQVALWLPMHALK